MNKGYSLLLVGFLAAFSAVNTFAAGESSLPSDLQDLKSEVLSLNSEVTKLENELLFPSSSTTVLMGVNAGSKIRLVDVKLSVDDQIVSYHAYDANGKDFQRTVNYSFSKNSLRKIVEIKASNDNSNVQPALFSFREWESKN